MMLAWPRKGSARPGQAGLDTFACDRQGEVYGVGGQLIKRMSTVAPPYPMGNVPSMVFTQPPYGAAPGSPWRLARPS